MIRVLHVGLSNNPGGVENLVLNYYKNIDRRQIEFDYLDIYGEGIAFSNEIEELGGKIYIVSNYKKHPLKAKKEITNLLKRCTFDIVHIHMQSAANLLPVNIAANNKKVKVICHSHSSSTPKGNLRKIFDVVNKRKIRSYPVNKWACGVRAGVWMWGEEFDSSNIIPNAIDYKLYRKNESIKNKLKNKLGFTEKDIVIGFVGRFGDEKNTFFLIEVLKELLKISNNYKLLTVGGNGLYDLFLKKISDEKLDNNYYSAGIQSSTYEWYQMMDCFLLPSFFEGFPMVGVEAQAAGLPCFLSDKIAKEIDISRNVKFLSIEGENAPKEWAIQINNEINSRNSESSNFPELYKIEYAAKILEKKYYSILK